MKLLSIDLYLHCFKFNIDNMKMKFHFFTVIVLLSVHIQAQFDPIDVKYVVDYDVTFRPISGVKSVFKDISHILVISDGKSLYTEKNNFIIDTTINNAVKRGENPISYATSFTNLQRLSEQTILKDKINNEIYVKDKLSALDIHFKENMPIFNWKLSDNKETIAGYSCSQATLDYAGRSYVAWYTEEIPIPEGPWKFKGLPGLIVKIEDNEGDYKMLLKGVKQRDFEVLLTSFSDSQLKTRKVFYKSLDNFYENPVVAFEADGQVFTPEVRKLFNEKYRAIYKYIGKNRLERKSNN